ncbi:hypothetical protein BC938DRAFT_479789 [Jimgerdemannia flammicorona]|uniref:Uncharacterized protein n=1 Tax=Jimgerdemannia flammicorona TaxID=994334 RepID=A0A433QK69_9FUNG|nr:hypothetical protein BC938DRAFT_479789 [Jimgerdemannia flammicorona]
MGGPKLEVFKVSSRLVALSLPSSISTPNPSFHIHSQFGVYIFFPVGVMLYFGGPDFYNKFVSHINFWPPVEQTHVSTALPLTMQLRLPPRSPNAHPFVYKPAPADNPGGHPARTRAAAH